jgi:hypothetical protein
MSRSVIGSLNFSRGLDSCQNFIVMAVNLTSRLVRHNFLHAMDEFMPSHSLSADDFSALVLTEKLRRAVRKYPEDQLLRSALDDAETLILLPKDEQRAQRDRLLAVLEAHQNHNS